MVIHAGQNRRMFNDRLNSPSTPCIDGLVQDCSNTSAIAMELLQSYTKPSISRLDERAIGQVLWIFRISISTNYIELHFSLIFTKIYLQTKYNYLSIPNCNDGSGKPPLK